MPAAPSSSAAAHAAGLQGRARAVSLSDINVVLHGGYSRTDHAVQSLTEKGETYVAEHLDTPGSLFWLILLEFDGEFKLGLARRSSLLPLFPGLIDTASFMYVEWFARKSTNFCWGSTSVSFKPFIETYDQHRRPVVGRSFEPVVEFLPVVVDLTISSTATEPTIRKLGLRTLRQYISSHHPELHRQAAAASHTAAPARRGRGSNSSEEERGQSGSDESESYSHNDSGGTASESGSGLGGGIPAQEQRCKEAREAKGKKAERPCVPRVARHVQTGSRRERNRKSSAAGLPHLFYQLLPHSQQVV